MASNKKVVQQLQILLETLGYQKVNKELKTTTKNMDRVRNKTEQTATAQNKMKRTQEGVHKTSLASGKEFSRQAQGLGGLVRAYATVAANVFALSSAFLVLKRAADFDSMMISANSMTKVMGVNVATLAKDLQMATGANLSFAQSLEITNKALAAGFNASQFSELGDLVTKISQTFGGSIEANMNKVTQAILRGRTETLATMGVVIDLEQAYSSYALTLGKTRQELTKFEEQQATLNAFLKQGQDQLGDIQKDPNPYDKMLRGLQDVAQEVMTTLSKNIFNPLISILNSSREVALALMATLAAVFAKQLTPDMTAYATAAKDSISGVVEANKKRAIAQRRADAQRLKRAKADFDTLKLAKVREVKKWAAEEVKKVGTVDKVNKTIRTIYNATEQEIIAGSKDINRALGTVQAQITNLGKNPGSITVMKGVREAVAKGKGQDLFTAAAISGASSGKNFAGALKTVDLSASNLLVKMRVLTTSVLSTGNALRKQAAMARLSALSFIHQNGIIAGTIQAYTHATRALRYNEAQLRNVSRGYVAAATAARVFGTTVALAGAAINRAIPALMSLWLVFEFGKAIINKLKGSITKDMEAIEEAIKASGEFSEDFKDKMSDLDDVLLKFDHDKTFSNLAKAINFVGNATSETASEINKLVNSFNRLAFTEVDGTLVSVTSRLEELTRRKNELESANDRSAVGLPQGAAYNYSGIAIAPDPVLEEVNNELEDTKNKLDAISKSAAGAIGSVLNNFSLLTNLRERAGANPDILNKQVTDTFNLAIESAKKRGVSPEYLEALRDMLLNGATKAAIETFVENNRDQLGDIIPELGSLTSVILTNVSNIDSAIANSVKQFENLMLETRKFKEEGKNAYLKAIGADQIVGMLQQFDNSIKTIEGSGDEYKERLDEVFEGEQGKFLRNYFNVSSVDELSALVSRVLGEYTILAKRLQDLKSSADVLKATQQALKAVDSSLLGDSNRVDNVREIAEIERKILNNKRQQILTDIDILNKGIESGKLSEENAIIAEQEVRALEEQAIAYKVQLDTVSPIFEAEKERLKIIQEINKAVSSTFDDQLKLLDMQKPFLVTAKQAYNWEVKRAIVLQRQLKHRQQEIKADQASLASTAREAGDNPELIGQLNREQFRLDRENLLLEQQIATQNRENNLVLMEALAKTGDISANTFTFQEAIRDSIREFEMGMDSAGKRFADAALDTMDSHIDLLINNLLEGTGSFSESIKEIFRSNLGNILTDNIKGLVRKGLSNIPGLGGEASNDPIEIATSQLVELQTQSAILTAMLSQGLSEEDLAKLEENFQGGLAALGQSLLGQMGISSSSVSGSVISTVLGGIFGMAKGGIVQGGINRYANGTITSGPELAMIGEGRNEEAVVPLPNNREIPVQLSGETGNRIEVNNTFDFRNADVSSERRLRAEAERIKQDTFNTVFSEIGKGGRYAKAVGRR